MAKGGRREGSGRKPGQVSKATLTQQEMKHALVEMFKKHQEEVYEALLTKSKQGDVPAIRELLDRIFGKAPQTSDITSGGERISFDITDEQKRKLAEEILKKR